MAGKVKTLGEAIGMSKQASALKASQQELIKAAVAYVCAAGSKSVAQKKAASIGLAAVITDHALAKQAGLFGINDIALKGAKPAGLSGSGVRDIVKGKKPAGISGLRDFVGKKDAKKKKPPMESEEAEKNSHVAKLVALLKG